MLVFLLGSDLYQGLKVTQLNGRWLALDDFGGHAQFLRCQRFAATRVIT